MLWTQEIASSLIFSHEASHTILFQTNTILTTQRKTSLQYAYNQLQDTKRALSAFSHPEQKHDPTASEAWESTPLFYKWGSETPMRNAISTPVTNQLARQVTERVQNSWGLIVHLLHQPILPVLCTAASMHTELWRGKDRTKDTGGKESQPAGCSHRPKEGTESSPASSFCSQRHFYVGEHSNYPQARDVPAVG